MAYSTGSYANPNSLLDSFRAFLLDNGWVINMFATVGTGRRLHARKGLVYINMRSFLNETISHTLMTDGASVTTAMAGINGYISTGYDGASLWNAQPGRPVYGTYTRGGFIIGLNSAGPAYHFFAYPDTDEVFCVAEFESGKIQMFGFGTLAKYSAGAEGGQWMSMPTSHPQYGVYLPSGSGVDASSSASMLPFRSSSYNGGTQACSTYIRANIDGHDGWAGEGRDTAQSNSPIACASSEVWDKVVSASISTPANWQTQMFPIVPMISRTAAIAYSPFGEILNLRRLDISNYELGEEFTLGPDTWKTFPMFQKNGYTLSRGFAVRKVT